MYPERDADWFKRIHSAKVAVMMNQMPPELVRDFKQARQFIVGDPEYTKNWMFAGFLPEKHKSVVISLISKAREHLAASETVASSDEVNYVGPVPSIKSAVEFQFPEDLEHRGVPQIKHSIDHKIYLGQPDYL